MFCQIIILKFAPFIAGLNCIMKCLKLLYPRLFCINFSEYIYECCFFFAANVEVIVMCCSPYRLYSVALLDDLKNSEVSPQTYCR